MFSIQQKRDISDKIQRILRETNHPELAEGEIVFNIKIEGKESWSWANIKNNASAPNPTCNPWNERNDR